ncbi:putative phosphatase [Planctomycetales bacterium 10988]|nr:putative phosphatase [Planctomycetales bacterium 10988]
MSVSRRNFLTYVGVGSYAALCQPWTFSHASSNLNVEAPKIFEPIEASSVDDLLLPEGFSYNIIAKYGDKLGSTVPTDLPEECRLKELAGQPETFGYNNDFTVFFPIDALENGDATEEGLLWVNHEYPSGLFLNGFTKERWEKKEYKSKAEIFKEMSAVGGSILHLKKEKNGKWHLKPNSKYTRRVTAGYPDMEVTGPAKSLLDAKGTCFGTLANCSGGKTPWNTVLTCEENFEDYNSDDRSYNHNWKNKENPGIIEEHYGWIVEVDPFDELKPRKLTALGRFRHENAAMRWNGPERKLVVYMGDDKKDEHLYKFVTKDSFRPEDDRATQRNILSEGTLYAACLETGKWIALDFDSNKETLLAAGFNNQAEVLLDASKAACALGASKLDRPEDCEIHPHDGSLYVALTNNTDLGDFHGSIIQLVEKENNPEGTEFDFRIFLAGGPKSGLSCPDNLHFDPQGNMWVACDISSFNLNEGDYSPFKNNGVFVIPTFGPNAGTAYQFASGPVGAELTGTWFSDDYSTLFLSVQHPGENTESLDDLKSNWPSGKAGDRPVPAVVAITGFNW